VIKRKRNTTKWRSKKREKGRGKGKCQ